MAKRVFGKRIFTSKRYKVTFYRGDKFLSWENNRIFNVLNIDICYIWIAIVLPKWCEDKNHYVYAKAKPKE